MPVNAPMNLPGISPLSPPSHDETEVSMLYDTINRLIARIQDNKNSGRLSAWIVTLQPDQLAYEIRRYEVTAKGYRPTLEAYSAPSLAVLRKYIPQGKTQIPNRNMNIPHIVEAWI